MHNLRQCCMLSILHSADRRQVQWCNVGTCQHTRSPICLPVSCNKLKSPCGQTPQLVPLWQADEGLRQLRFRLVPKYCSEEQFWQRYFAAVAKVKQQVEAEYAWGDFDMLGSGAEDNTGLCIY